MAANMRWTTCIKNFMQRWKVLKDRKKDAKIPEGPKITKTLIVAKWTEAFTDFSTALWVLGLCHSLSYVTHEKTVVPAPSLATNQPFSTKHGSNVEELIARASYIYALFLMTMPKYATTWKGQLGLHHM